MTNSLLFELVYFMTENGMTEQWKDGEIVSTLS